MDIHVPDITSTVYCLAQKLDRPGVMTRCTLPKNHEGVPHSWEKLGHVPGSSVETTREG